MPRGNNGESQPREIFGIFGAIFWGKCVEFGTLAMGYQHWEFHRIPVSETIAISADLESRKKFRKEPG